MRQRLTQAEAIAQAATLIAQGYFEVKVWRSEWHEGVWYVSHSAAIRPIERKVYCDATADALNGWRGGI